MNDDKEKVDSQEESSNLKTCCDGGGYCPSGSDNAGKNWKIVISILIVVAAGAVLARSIIKKSGNSTKQGQDTFATIQPDLRLNTLSPVSPETTKQNLTATNDNAETSGAANEKTEQDVLDKVTSALWKPELDSIASLGKVAADSDAVFILLTVDDQQSNQAAIKEIESAAKKIQTGGTRVSAFRLKQDAPNYANLKEQLSVPCVLALVKGGGLCGVPSDQITESKLVQAFVAASRPSSGCCPSGGSCCPTQ